MKVDAFAIRLRPRSGVEAADLGVRICQSAAGQVFRCHVAVTAVVIAIAFATFPIAAWLPPVILLISKTWLDRTVLFVLSRAVFGQRTTLANLWDAQREVWWSQLLRTLTLRRLSPWRSFTQPVYQLEGLSGAQRRKRLHQIRAGRSSAAAALGMVFNAAELALILSLAVVLLWMIPQGYLAGGLTVMLARTSQDTLYAFATVGYSITLLFLEPFYVAAGFAMYLNRRAELEAWDIEQELRSAFAR